LSAHRHWGLSAFALVFEIWPPFFAAIIWGFSLAILVTGGAGYIGSHAARTLRRYGHEVVLYDNLSTGFHRLALGFELVEGDIADEAKLRPVLARVEAVMHFAAHAYVGESVENPRKYFQNNVLPALSLLNSTLDAGIRRFVFSSTCAVYGVPEKIPIDEQTPCEPVNPYGASKLFFENALGAYSRAYGLRSISLRYFNAAGADESGETGELHDPETHLIPLALAATAENGPELKVYGSDYPTPDGTCVRDYIHVNDLADAHVLARPQSGNRAGTFRSRSYPCSGKSYWTPGSTKDGAAAPGRSSDLGGRCGEGSKSVGMDRQAQPRRHRVECVDLDAEKLERVVSGVRCHRRRYSTESCTVPLRGEFAGYGRISTSARYLR
jgi:UDP-glucose-4-epimerase GalE